MSVMTSSCVGPATKSRWCRSLMRSSSGPYSDQRLDSCHSSAGWMTGMTSSNAPARFISSRMMRSTFCSVRRPIGSQL